VRTSSSSAKPTSVSADQRERLRPLGRGEVDGARGVGALEHLVLARSERKPHSQFPPLPSPASSCPRGRARSARVVADLHLERELVLRTIEGALERDRSLRQHEHAAHVLALDGRDLQRERIAADHAGRLVRPVPGAAQRVLPRGERRRAPERGSRGREQDEQESTAMEHAESSSGAR
jgi:hypothetical protein